MIREELSLVVTCVEFFGVQEVYLTYVGVPTVASEQDKLTVYYAEAYTRAAEGMLAIDQAYIKIMLVHAEAALRSRT